MGDKARLGTAFQIEHCVSCCGHADSEHTGKKILGDRAELAQLMVRFQRTERAVDTRDHSNDHEALAVREGS